MLGIFLCFVGGLLVCGLWFLLLLAVSLTYFLAGGGVQYIFWTDRQTSRSVGNNDVRYGKVRYGTVLCTVGVVDSNPISFFYDVVVVDGNDDPRSTSRRICLQVIIMQC